MTIPDEIKNSVRGRMATFSMLLAGMIAGGRISPEAAEQIEGYVTGMMELAKEECDKKVSQAKDDMGWEMAR